MSRLAVMQPYCFPYLGYFHLVCAVDEFVFLDDANYIKGGFINRNSILLNGQPHRFTLPVQDISSFRSIRDHRYLDSPTKFLDLLHHAYRKAPFFGAVQELITRVLSSPDRSVSSINIGSVVATCDYLQIHQKFSVSSEIDPNPKFSGQERVIQLCELRKASVYINAAGGRNLYDPSRFEDRGLELGFVQPRFPEYQQPAKSFIAGLSIIDVLMWNPPERVATMLNEYSIEFPQQDRGHS